MPDEEEQVSIPRSLFEDVYRESLEKLSVALQHDILDALQPFAQQVISELIDRDAWTAPVGPEEATRELRAISCQIIAAFAAAHSATGERGAAP